MLQYIGRSVRSTTASVLQIPTTTTTTITTRDAFTTTIIIAIIGRSVRSTTIASVLQIPTTPPPTTPIIPKKKSRNLNLNSRYGTSRRSALLVVASYS